MFSSICITEKEYFWKPRISVTEKVVPLNGYVYESTKFENITCLKCLLRRYHILAEHAIWYFVVKYSAVHSMKVLYIFSTK